MKTFIFHLIKKKETNEYYKTYIFNRLVLINLKAMLSNNVLHRPLYSSQHVLVYSLTVRQNSLSHHDPNLTNKNYFNK